MVDIGCGLLSFARLTVDLAMSGFMAGRVGKLKLSLLSGIPSVSSNSAIFIFQCIQVRHTQICFDFLKSLPDKFTEGRRTDRSETNFVMDTYI